MTVPAVLDRPEERQARPAALITNLARRSFAALSREQAQAVLQVRPDPVAAVRRPGPDPYHVLLFGAGVLRGVGLRTHNLGLAGRIADELVQRRGRGVHIDVVVEPQVTAPKAMAGLAGLRLRRYDAVVVVLGEQDTAHFSAAQWRGAVVGLVKLLVSETCPDAGIFLYDSVRASLPTVPDPISIRAAAAAADRLVTVTEDVCAMAERVRFGEFPLSVLPADPIRGFSDGTYRDWALWMTDRLESALPQAQGSAAGTGPQQFRNRRHDERLRQRAVASLRLRGDRSNERLDREIRQARLLYRADAAALTIVDGEITYMRATTEPVARVVERSQSFCDIGIRADGLLVINDTLLDARTCENPLALGPNGIRFYAGHPVHTWDGYRIGMVCIYGSTPRATRPRDLDGLRDIAARIEELLWQDALRLVQPA